MVLPLIVIIWLYNVFYQLTCGSCFSTMGKKENEWHFSGLLKGSLELAKYKTAFRNAASKGTAALLMTAQVWVVFFCLSFTEKFRATVEAAAYYSAHEQVHTKNTH